MGTFASPNSSVIRALPAVSQNSFQYVLTRCSGNSFAPPFLTQYNYREIYLEHVQHTGTIGFKAEWARLVLSQNVSGTIGFAKAAPYENDFNSQRERLVLSKAVLGTIGFKAAPSVTIGFENAFMSSVFRALSPEVFLSTSSLSSKAVTAERPCHAHRCKVLEEPLRHARQHRSTSFSETVSAERPRHAHGCKAVEERPRHAHQCSSMGRFRNYSAYSVLSERHLCRNGVIAQ